jgi:sensor histidine kinase YesM
LELVPYFRRWPRSWQRDVLYTFIWNMLFGTVLGVITMVYGDPWPFWKFVWMQFVMTQTIGFSIHILFDITGQLLGSTLDKAPGWVRGVYFMLVPLFGLFIGYGLGSVILDLPGMRRYVFSTRGMVSISLFSLILTGALSIAFLARARQMRIEADLANQRQRALDAERRALEAQLRMLQAQIEPHFLYNTLANAVGLIAPAPDKARLLLERLIDYLRASLTESREQQIRLGRELDTIRAYLDLMTVRMGERLHYRIECPPELADVPMAPMLLQPVVENAIQHGLEPKIEGGGILITVHREDNSLRIDIADTGKGFDPAARPRPGGGIGLSNLRERLATLYDTAGQLALSDNPGGGVRVTIRLPMPA